MFEFLSAPAAQIIILIWGIVWVLLAMWKSVKKNQRVWFVVLFAFMFFSGLIGYIQAIWLTATLSIINSFGILSILYFYIFSRFSFKNNVLTFDKW